MVVNIHSMNMNRTYISDVMDLRNIPDQEDAGAEGFSLL